MLPQVFVFGVIVPTLVTVVVFIGFLLCWFKLGMRDHFAKQHTNASTRGQQSACSGDSLCDVTGSTSCGSDTQHSICVHKVNVIDDMSCVIERDMMTRVGCPVNGPLDGTDQEGAPTAVSDSSCADFIQTDMSDSSGSDNYGHVEPSTPVTGRQGVVGRPTQPYPIWGTTHHPV
ncbi:hypothetical protein NP493_395g00012 [Ridgeia piscesae]|uniref:Uncharacterized protein n=1 Tax=Ridgeia piscesae TaxID=27915 RepID=A0AAD9L1U3_RIDPI|nr:hypothetical protein NP493_395g00012 [Ridgeia piscesae]